MGESHQERKQECVLGCNTRKAQCRPHDLVKYGLVSKMPLVGDEQQVIDLANTNHFPMAQLISVNTSTGKPLSLWSVLG